MSTVGIVANPAAGKDVRRLVGNARFVPNHEKVGVLRRVLSGLEATGIERLIVMPDSASLVPASIDGLSPSFEVTYLDMPVFGSDVDSTRAAELMAELDVSCLITLGGDGTNRAVVKGSVAIPLVPISTGTNNVFPSAIEGTVAGLAAGLVARGMVELDLVSKASALLEVLVDGQRADVALVDVAVSKVGFVGARAVWDMDTLHEVFLARADPGSVGLSSIGGLLHGPLGGQDGMHILLGRGGTEVTAPVMPGIVSTVSVKATSPLHLDERVEVTLRPGTVALDGERTFSLPRDGRVEVALRSRGPRVVSADAALREATKLGLFSDGTVRGTRR